MLNRALRYAHTVRYLRPGQILGRLWFHAWSPRPESAPPPPPRIPVCGYPEPIRRAPSLLSPRRFRLLGREHELPEIGGWDDVGLPKLWRYNLHYFDDLNAHAATDREAWHRGLIERWIAENPPGVGTGWEPYPTSMRISNWVKWALRGNALPATAAHSLAVQARWLAKRLERHLLGNHLLANAKALVHAGAYFDGAEAAGWLRTGMTLWTEQLPEQLLPDGGHFELSPMYHALVLEDLLDTANALRACGVAMPATWNARLAPMQRWLAVMTHPDGEIGFFNDAAFGIAASPAELARYASRSGFGSADHLAPHGCSALAASGYLRLARADAVALLDCAVVGPDHLPAHAHADTLSFELSLFGRRVLVNSGTSQYGVDAERQRQRGTAAHNTVVVDDADSSEVWAGFRVARRARPGPVTVSETGRAMTVACSHDGYRRLSGRNRHARRWTLGDRSLAVEDTLTGARRHARARFHLHPDVAVEDVHRGGVRLRCADGRQVGVRFDGARAVRVEATTWHPAFGACTPNRCLVAELGDGDLRAEFSW